jgi:hypothetical protein
MDYEAMYSVLFNKTTDVCAGLESAQRDLEDMQQRICNLHNKVSFLIIMQKESQIKTEEMYMEGGE